MNRFQALVFFFILSSVSSFSQTFTDSNLPIVIIDTDGGVTIPDDPRVLANMKIIYRGSGQRTYLTDKDTKAYLNYNGRINIEVRGSSSQTLPKKQYGFSTLKADNVSNNNVVLLGLPKDNDWILNGLAYDPSLMRDYINYNLSRMIGVYASRTVYCELVLNGVYTGLYVLQEKIKAGTDRLDLKKIGTLDNAYPDVTGGYITKADKTTGGDPVAWTMSSYIGTDDVTFIHDLPKPEDVTALQNDYIHGVFLSLADAASKNNTSLINGYPSIIDVPSFVDHMILEELGSNSDAYQFSAYFHKDRNGKLRAGPIWDLNLTFGYDLTFWGLDRSKPNVWQFSNGDNEGPKFWRDLYNNPQFKCCLSRRWNQLIQPGQPLNYSSIEALIDKTYALISEAAVRENQRWGTVPDLVNEINSIKQFLQIRIPWMTNTIGPSSSCSPIVLPPLVITKIMYNSDTSKTFPDSDKQEFIEITNTGSQTVNLTGVYFSELGFGYQFPPASVIAGNSSLILAGNSDVFIAKYGISPFGQFTRNLSDNGEKLVLADGFGNVIDSLTYRSKSPWPNASGNGYYLQLTDPLSDNSVATNWTASKNVLVSTGETINNGQLKVWPAPVRTVLTIESPDIIRFVELYDSRGTLLKKLDVNSETYYLDMSSFRNGLYMVNVISQHRSQVKKVIKE